MHSPLCPSLYQINTRVWLTDLSYALGRPATLDDIPDEELDKLATTGFDWIWLLSVWQTGPAGQRVLAPTRSGAENSRRRCRTFARRTSQVPGSPSRATAFMTCLVGGCGACSSS